MTEHIDDDRLRNDPLYRFEYVSKFLNFTQNDIKIINESASILLPSIPVIIDTVYRKLFSYDVTKQKFILSDRGFENLAATKDNDTILQSPQMIYRKDMLSTYLKRLLTQADWNDTFIQYIIKIGQIHSNKNGTSPIHVQFIHINALLGYMEHLLVDKVWITPTIDDKTKREIVMALNKLFWIQNDLFSMQYDMSPYEKSETVEPEKMHVPSCCLLN